MVLWECPHSVSCLVGKGWREGIIVSSIYGFINIGALII